MRSRTGPELGPCASLRQGSRQAPEVHDAVRPEPRRRGCLLTPVVDEPLELGGRPGQPPLGRTGAPAPIGLAGPEERLPGHVEPAGPGGRRPHRLPPKTAETAGVGPAPRPGEHTPPPPPPPPGGAA